LKIQGRLARWLIAFGVGLLRIWARTLRFALDDRAGIAGQPVTQNYIGALWHNRLLIFPLVLQRFFPNRKGAALISASRDGDLLTDAIKRFGFDVVRGSSSRLGAPALLQLSDTLAAGRDVVITPDGPRGPAYELGHFPRTEVGCAGVADEPGVFKLLAPQKLGPLYHPAAILKRTRHHRRSTFRYSDQDSRGIRSRALASSRRHDVAGGTTLNSTLTSVLPG
jgi:hypothetical protein